MTCARWSHRASHICGAVLSGFEVTTLAGIIDQAQACRHPWSSGCTQHGAIIIIECCGDDGGRKRVMVGPRLQPDTNQMPT